MNKELDNWIGWIQKRIPEAKKGYNEGWIRQALDGYAQEQIKLLNLDFVTNRTFYFDYIGETFTNAEGRRVGEIKSEQIKAANIDQAISIFKEKHPDTPFDPPY